MRKLLFTSVMALFLGSSAADRKCALEASLRLAILSLVSIHIRQIGEGLAHVRVGTAMAGLSVTSRWNGNAVSGPEGTTRS